jgi:hypothetical protein
MKALFTLLARLWRPRTPVFSQPDAWQHPALSRMTERELADLPFPRQPGISCSDR